MRPTRPAARRGDPTPSASRATSRSSVARSVMSVGNASARPIDLATRVVPLVGRRGSTRGGADAACALPRPPRRATVRAMRRARPPSSPVRPRRLRVAGPNSTVARTGSGGGNSSSVPGSTTRGRLAWRDRWRASRRLGAGDTDRSGEPGLVADVRGSPPRTRDLYRECEPRRPRRGTPRRTRWARPVCEGTQDPHDVAALLAVPVESRREEHPGQARALGPLVSPSTRRNGALSSWPPPHPARPRATDDHRPPRVATGRRSCSTGVERAEIHAGCPPRSRFPTFRHGAGSPVQAWSRSRRRSLDADLVALGAEHVVHERSVFVWTPSFFEPGEQRLSDP